ncbi:MAG: hypothetical protein ACT4OJ_00890 [Bacteroidota bacterium]
MTHRNSFSLALTAAYIFFSLAAGANDHRNNSNENNPAGKGAQTEKQADHPSSGKHVPVSEEGHAKVPHGKGHTPHSEELPHIHKFHKERVKKIKKHHGKCWFLSQALLLICHAAVLYISYLHVVH